MLTIEEKQLIILSRIRSISDEVVSLFNFSNSGLNEEEASYTATNILNKMAIKAALQKELDSLTQVQE